MASSRDGLGRTRWIADPFVDYRTPEDAYFHQPSEKLERVRETVDSLPEPYRLYLEALFWERLSIREVANRFGRTPNAMTSLVGAAQREFTRRFDEPIAPNPELALIIDKHATFRVDRGRAYIGLPGRRVNGVLEVLRLLDQVQGLLRRRRVKAKAALMRRYCNSRLVNRNRALTDEERGMIEALSD